MKLVSWNVNGIRACVKKGFLEYFDEVDADIFCIQETKLQEGQIDLMLNDYEQYWNYAEKKGYSGTAVFTKIKPPLKSAGYSSAGDFTTNILSNCDDGIISKEKARASASELGTALL